MNHNDVIIAEREAMHKQAVEASLAKLIDMVVALTSKVEDLERSQSKLNRGYKPKADQ